MLLHMRRHMHCGDAGVPVMMLVHVCSWSKAPSVAAVCHIVHIVPTICDRQAWSHLSW